MENFRRAKFEWVSKSPPGYWINDNYDLTGDAAIAKNDPLVAQLKAWVDAEYENGRQSTLCRHELEAKVQEFAPGRFQN